MYPHLHPYETMMFHVDTLRKGTSVKLYVEWSGNPNGIPVVYLHGGPGDHSSPPIRRFYNPAHYNIILFDQRGCGKSTPRGQLEKNTTADLLLDIERIRELKGYESWVVSGGSWGSSLALLYAQAYPSRVRGLILRGVYDLSQKSCVDSLFPEMEEEINQLVQCRKGTHRFKRILKVLQTRKSKRLASLLMSSDPLYVKTAPPPEKKSVYYDALVNVHYEAHRYFVPRRTIYKNMTKIRHIPTFMVNGRWDIVTPPSIAYTLSKAMKTCKLYMVDAGHTANEPAIGNQLARCADDMYRILQK
jgi:proline iminopeptidase